MLTSQEKVELKLRIIADIDRPRFEEQVRQNLCRTVAAMTDALDYATIADAVIETAENEQWIDHLLASLAATYSDEDARPVGALARDLGLKHMGISGLQSMIAKIDATFDWSLSAQRSLIIRRYVCLIEINGAPRGTGVLVGPNLVLTSQHVIAPLFDAQGNPLPGAHELLVFHFDFYNNLVDDRPQPNPRTTRLAAVNWLREQSPPHALERMEKPPPDDTPVAELDFALLCTAQAVGNEVLSDGRPRSWAQARPNARPLALMQRIHISQHPGAQPLTGSSGSIWQLPANGARIRYDASTLQVSSGSPCWDNSLRLVAVHNFGGVITSQGKLNQGVPISKIVEQLAACAPPIDLAVPPSTPTANASSLAVSYPFALAGGRNRIWRIGAKYPVLGRTALQKQLGSMASDDGAQLLLIRGGAGSGKTFTIHIIREFMRPLQHTVLDVTGASLLNRTPGQALSDLRMRIGMPVEVPVPGQDLTTRPAEIGRHLVSGFYAQLREKLQPMTASAGVPMQLWLVFDGFSEHTLGDDIHEMIVELLRQMGDVQRLRIALLGYDRALPSGAADFSYSEDISPVTHADVLAHLAFAFDSLRRQPLPDDDMKNLADTIMNGAPAEPSRRAHYIGGKVRDMVLSLEA